VRLRQNVIIDGEDGRYDRVTGGKYAEEGGL